MKARSPLGRASGGRRSYRVCLALAASFLLASQFAPPASAAVGLPPSYWSDPYGVATGPSYLAAPTLLSLPDGGAALLWLQGGVHLLRWSLQDGWGDEAITGSGILGTGTVSAAVDAGGNITAAWFGNLNDTLSLLASRFAPLRGWSEPAAVATVLQGQPYAPAVAASPSGHAWIVWLETDSMWWPGCRCIRSASFSQDDGWSPPTLLANGTSQYWSTPSLATLPGSRALAAWLETSENVSHVRTALLDSDGGWAPFADGAQGRAGFFTRPAVFGRGDHGALLTWQESGWAGWMVRASLLSPTLEWSAPFNVSSGNVEGRAPPAISTDESGRTFLSWPTRDWSEVGSAVRSIGPDGAWDSITTLASGRNILFSDPSVGAGRGPAVAMWIEQDSSSRQFYWSLKEEGVPWRNASREWRFDNGYYEIRDLSLTATAGGAMAAFILDNGTNATLAVATLSYADVTAPPLEILAPTDGFVSASPTVEVRGRTEPGAHVTIGGVLAAVAPNGSFATVVALIDGQREIEVTSMDPAGNVAARRVNITYMAPGGGWGTLGAGPWPLLSMLALVVGAGLALWGWRAARGARKPPPGRP